ncbi:chemotaxis protein CheW [Pseudomarimonas salicorniae]|uniref:Chemotaxis protein CheW n=1 Tax=Pseudomarimonas salicorniae TaxID=2933270 RepID=A0ABT0GFN9_9GAMM|nr:chemotaxis protein CheW [Lysobacter sp. CAU 1642]MCK7593362.1 chemotaxis protein CheW [Lysobacter sp. CAU 1642]
MSGAHAVQSAEQLRQAFDSAFAIERESASEGAGSLLRIAVGAEARVYVMDLSGLALVRKSPRIVPLPGAAAELRGLATMRGRTVPVFSLARLLGLAVGREPGWTVGVGAELDFALQFEQLEAIIQVRPSQLREAPNEQLRHVRSLCVVGTTSLPVLDIESIRGAIRPDARKP